MKKVKQSMILFAFVAILSGTMLSTTTFATKQPPCDDWDNYFDGFSCVGSGAYCWGGEG